MQNSLVTTHSFMSAHAVTKLICIFVSYEFCEPVYCPVKTNEQAVITIQLKTETDAETRMLRTRLQDELRALNFPVLTR
jgi:hypothetical protein